MKKVLFCALALIIGLLVMETGFCADSFDDFRLQSTSNKPIIFINGYWIKPIHTEKQLTGFAFIPHAIAAENKMETIIQVTDSCKGLDSIAEDFSSDLLVSHAKRQIEDLLVVDLGTSLDNWWRGAIDTPIFGGGYADSGWWNEIGDGIIFDDDLFGAGTNDIDSSDGNWWEGSETVYFGDDPINTNFDTGEDDPEPGEDDFKPHDPDEEWWRDEEEEEDEEEQSGITHCPPPGVCFQTEAIDALGLDQGLLWDSVNIILNTVMADGAANMITYAPTAKGETGMSVVLLPTF